jgi:hypothetical protein
MEWQLNALNVTKNPLGFARANELAQLILEGDLLSNFTNDTAERRNRAIFVICNGYGETIAKTEGWSVLGILNSVRVGHLFIPK